jgi:hypothetical protein
VRSLPAYLIVALTHFNTPAAAAADDDDDDDDDDDYDDDNDDDDDDDAFSGTDLRLPPA